MEKEYCMITTTFDDELIAKKVIEVLLEKRLISCAQLIDISS